MYIGGQPAWLSFDTGSEWLAVASGYRHVYEPKKSALAHRISKELLSEHYGSTDLTGRAWSDAVCLAEGEGCANDFPLIAIKTQEGLPDSIDGILGLGPNLRYQEKKLMLAKNPRSVSLMKYLRQQDII